MHPFPSFISLPCTPFCTLLPWQPREPLRVSEGWLYEGGETYRFEHTGQATRRVSALSPNCLRARRSIGVVPDCVQMAVCTSIVCLLYIYLYYIVSSYFQTFPLYINIHLIYTFLEEKLVKINIWIFCSKLLGKVHSSI